jgi:MYXO-CTERM domain-containing protein
MKRLTGTLCALLLATVIVTPAANAHQGNPNFRSEITSISPAAQVRGLEMSVKNFDDNIELTNRTGKVVLIKGYDGEPYLRFSPDGRVEVNLNSPAYYLNEDRLGDVPLPDRADAEAAPEWEEVDDTGTWSWHDHRSHYMSEGVPPQVTDESVVTRIFDYTIPMSVGGVPVKASGTLTWVGSDSSVPVLPFVGLGLLLVAALAGAVVIRRRRQEDAESGSSGGDTGKEAW